MNTAKGQSQSDLRKNPEDLQREADGLREDLVGTVDERMPCTESAMPVEHCRISVYADTGKVCRVGVVLGFVR